MDPMQLRIFTEPQQGASYQTLARVARAAEDLGFDAFFRSDHYMKLGPGTGLPGPTDSWVTLAALAVETSRIRLGTLVTCATFRLPGPLAIAVAQVDEMSGGRVEFGLGAGWFDAEHRAYGVPFPPLKERFDRFEEQLAIIMGLWETPEGKTFSFDGRYYAVTDSPGLPKPAQRPRTPAIAARYADEFNSNFVAPAEAAGQYGWVRDACRAEGRDPGSMTFTVANTVCCGKDDADLRRRAAAIGRDPDQLRTGAIAGSPAEIVDRIGQY